MTDPILVRRDRPVGPMHPGLPRASSVVGATVIAWFGLVVHNVADLPDQTLLSPETFWPTVVTLALLLAYAKLPVRVAGAGLFGWALLNLAGGALSVVPLPVLPFHPDQTVRHYSFHLLYAAAQIPLLAISHHLAFQPRSPSRSASRGSRDQLLAAPPPTGCPPSGTCVPRVLPAAPRAAYAAVSPATTTRRPSPTWRPTRATRRRREAE